MKFNVLHNFLSPVTGRILCDPDHVLVGNSSGIAIPTISIPIGNLPNLTKDHLWIGDENNRPIEAQTIQRENLPDIDNHHLWIGNDNRRPESREQISNRNLPNLDVNPALLFRGKIWRGQVDPSDPTNSFTIESDSLTIVEFALFVLQKEIVSLQSQIVGYYATIIALQAQVTALFILVEELRDRINRIAPSTTSNSTNSKFQTINLLSNINVNGGRIQNISPSPLDDYDAVCAKWVWDLLNDNVEIKWEER